MHFPHPLSRRRLLAGAGLAVACFSQPRSLQAQFGPTGFHVLRARNTTAALRGEGQAATPVWGYGETVPGPTLRVRRGDELRVRVFNDLDEPTTVHWHGVRLANAMDGVPYLTQPPIAPGEAFNYRFRASDAGTFWYHPTGDGGEQAGHGLYGVLIVGEAEKIEVDRDLVLVFDDWRLTPEGAIDATPDGRIGGHPTVNSVPKLDLPVRSNERLRLRLVNAARARPFSLRFDRHAVWVMAIDGQPAEPFLARDSRIILGPGNRIDLFLDATLEPGTSAPMMLENAGTEMPLAHLVYGREAIPLRALTRAQAVAAQSAARAPRIPRGVAGRTCRSRRERAPLLRRMRSGRCSRSNAAASSCLRWSIRRTLAGPSICTATACGCSTGSTTAGSRSGSTR